MLGNYGLSCLVILYGTKTRKNVVTIIIIIGNDYYTMTATKKSVFNFDLLSYSRIRYIRILSKLITMLLQTRYISYISRINFICKINSWMSTKARWLLECAAITQLYSFILHRSRELEMLISDLPINSLQES